MQPVAHPWVVTFVNPAPDAVPLTIKERVNAGAATYALAIAYQLAKSEGFDPETLKTWDTTIRRIAA